MTCVKPAALRNWAVTRQRVSRCVPGRSPFAMNYSRRQLLWSTLCAGGAGLTLDGILRCRAAAAANGDSPSDTSVIQIWLGGGPSQFETFDPKPTAPIEIRGPYDPISSAIPGVPVCETMPLTARVLDKTAIIRSFTHPYDDHFGLMRWCLAGRR